MMKQYKIIYLVSICAMVVGFIFMVGGFWGGAKYYVTAGLNGVHIVDTTPHTVKNLSLDAFQSIDLDAGQTNVEFVHSEHYGIDIRYYSDADSLEYAVENGTLKITKALNQEPRFKWLNLNFNLSTTQNTMKIYVPADVPFKNLKVKIGMGSVILDGYTSETTDIRLDFGDLKLRNAILGDTSITIQNGSSTIQSMTTKNLSFLNSFGKSSFENIKLDSAKDSTVKGQNGKISITNLTSTGPLVLENKFGNIQVNDLIAESVKSTLQNGSLEIHNGQVNDLTAENSFGDIIISQLQSNGLKLKNGNGKISLDGELKGTSTIKSDFGKISVKTSLALKQYNYDFSSSFGEIKINDQKQGNSVRINTGAENSLTISCGNGGINADFQP